MYYPKKTWRVVNELTSCNQTKNTSFVKEIKIGDTTIMDTKKLAENVNDHFVNIGPNLATKKIFPTLRSQRIRV